MKPSRLHSLDLFRGICGYGVAITHYFAYLYQHLYAEYLSLLFVEWFFVLSGFVLYPQLMKVLDNKKHLKTFYVRRWVRTLPLYILALICVSMVAGNLFSGDFFKYAVFAQKLFPGFVENDYFPVAWSLSIEEYFYLVFPLFLLGLNKDNFISRVLALLLAITAVKIVLSAYVDLDFYRTGTLLRLDAILLGFLGAHFRDRLLQHKLVLISLAITMLALFLYVRGSVFVGGVDKLGMVFFVAMLQATSFFALYFFVLSESVFKHKLLQGMASVMANQTYSIYLFHLIFLYIIKNQFIDVPGIFIYYLVALFLVSTIIFEYFEKPLLSCRPDYKA